MKPPPFAAAELYKSSGWTGPIALPHAQKFPPPEGFTGEDGRWPTADDFERWRGAGLSNIGLRLPPTVIGIDVDAYAPKRGRESLRKLVADFGELPATWWSTSRDDGISGIRLYTVPAGIDWPGSPGPDIETIQHRHRYLVAPPSIHPDGGEYRWRDPDGEWTNEIPGLGDLPDLPAAWLTGLTGYATSGQKVAERPGSMATKREDAKQAREWLRGLPGGEPCRYVGELTAAALGAAKREDGSAHDNTRDTLLSLLRAGETGHPGVAQVVKDIRAEFVATVADARPKTVAEAEFDRMVNGGVAIILADRGERAGQGCDCGSYGRGTINEEWLNGSKATKPTPLNVYSAADLEGWDIPEPRWAVPGLIPEGLVLLAGKPKAKKSFLGMNVGVSIALGGMALGKVMVEQGDVLYLALEDSPRRLQDRIRSTMQGDRFPPRFHFATEWPRFDAGGLEALDRWLTEHPDARLVIIDTLAKVRPVRAKNANPYDEDYAHMALIKALADRHRVAILVIHHLRKMVSDDPMDLVSGTNAITGAADAILILQRAEAAGGVDAQLHVRGRDMEDADLAMRFWKDRTSWEIAGEWEEATATGHRASIFTALRGGALSLKEMEAETGIEYRTLDKTVRRLVRNGELRKEGRSKYSLLKEFVRIVRNESENSDTSAGMSEFQRGQFGHSDISDTQCKAEGCRHLALMSGGPWCYLHAAGGAS